MGSLSDKVIYSYIPNKSGKASKLVVSLVFLVSFALMIYASLSPEYGKIIKIFSLSLLLIAIFLGYRYILTVFIYSIERETEGAPPDLVIRKVELNKTRIVCRVNISRGKLVESDKLTPKDKKSGKIYNFLSGFVKSRQYWFITCEDEGGDIILFEPDETMVNIISAICVK